jgi:hypothetical protein
MPDPLSMTLNGYDALNAAARNGTAISAESQAIRNSAREVVALAERSIALFGTKAVAISEIWALAAEHAHDGWDGEGARSVSLAAANLAASVVRALPGDLPMPELAPEPDGSISLDWIGSRSRLFSVSVGERDRLAYAWLDGTDKGHGVARFDGERIPPRVLDAIRETVLPPHASIRVA